MTIQKILVPVDFSSGSKAALAFAAELAQKFSAELHLLHAWEVPSYIPPEAMVGVPGHDTQSLMKVAKDHVEREMAEFLAAARADGVEVTKHALEVGDPARVIVEVAKNGGASLIVMGTHGRTGIARLLMGSVAEKVVRLAACPVVTVPTHE